MKGIEKSIEINATISLTNEDIDDIVSMAFDGGITYWCDCAKVVGDYLGEYASDQISRGGSVKLHDCEEEKWYELNLESFLKGFKIYMEKYFGYSYKNINPRQTVGKTYYTIDTGDFDAEDADCIIQCALFGEVVYG